MRLLTRRNLLAGGGVLTAAAVAGAALAQRPQAFHGVTPIRVAAQPISHLSNTDPDRTRFGSLVFRSGLVLRSDVSAFGGFSALWRSPKGEEIAALADNAQILNARVDMSDGRLSGLSRAAMAPLLLSDGTPARRSPYYDTESLAISGGVAFVGVERNHAVLRFQRDREGGLVQGVPIAVPGNLKEDLKDLPNNGGLEALALAPPRSSLAGALVGISEGGRGFILTGARPGSFELVRRDGYDVTDLAFLDSDDALVLERRFSLLGGFECRLRRIAPSAVRPGASVDGEVIYQSETSHRIDNMEGLAVHREERETVVSMISDNNFNANLQRTLLLEFILAA
ncbi:esterase-like activity of phytase family protein [Microvirga sp. M2]|uniref:esterase-like activity of phytase family protein n=1 Tax=Microvirga sp. M2 TaxID=3073270 RepID=UPI0039C0BB41